MCRQVRRAQTAADRKCLGQNEKSRIEESGGKRTQDRLTASSATETDRLTSSLLCSCVFRSKQAVESSVDDEQPPARGPLIQSRGALEFAPLFPYRVATFLLFSPLSHRPPFSRVVLWIPSCVRVCSFLCEFRKASLPIASCFCKLFTPSSSCCFCWFLLLLARCSFFVVLPCTGLITLHLVAYSSLLIIRSNRENKRPEVALANAYRLCLYQLSA